jgi:hypothetical protein
MPAKNFETIGEHLESIVKSIPQHDLLMAVERVDKGVHFKYFKGYRTTNITRKRIVEAFRNELLELKNDLLADIIIVFWNQNNRKVFNAMLAHVKTINEDVESIENIPDEKAKEFISDLLQNYTREEILICVRLNEVKFSEQIISEMLAGSQG